MHTRFVPRCRDQVYAAGMGMVAHAQVDPWDHSLVTGASREFASVAVPPKVMGPQREIRKRASALETRQQWLY